MFFFQSITAKIIGLIALCLSLVVGYISWEKHIYNQGFNAEKIIRDNTDLINNQKFEAQILSKDQANNQLQLAMNDKVNEVQLNLTKEKFDHEQTKKQLNDSVNRGTLQLRVGTVSTSGKSISCKSCDDSTIATGIKPEAGSVIVPSASNDILSVASDTSDLVRKYNSLIDLYNFSMLTCNKQ